MTELFSKLSSLLGRLSSADLHPTVFFLVMAVAFFALGLLRKKSS